MAEPAVVALADPEALAQHVADWLIALARASTGRFSLALSGGSTPKRLFEILAEPARASLFPWERTHLFWGDERFVPYDHPDSNYRMARLALLDHVPIPPAQVNPMPTEGYPSAAARAYQATLQTYYGAESLDMTRPLFDVVFLGLGENGHTASLFPGTAALDETLAWVAPVTQGVPQPRLTLTYPAIACSHASTKRTRRNESFLFLFKKELLSSFEALMPTRDDLKRQAAGQAADLVEDGMVVGLGTGSTAAFFIEALSARRPNIVCIPTSERSAAQARDGGLNVSDFAHHTSIDLCVDGADEIKRDTLDLVKGLGGALLREKLVASAAKRLVIIADQAKLVDWLGSTTPVPVEVTPFAWELTCARLAGIAETAVRRCQPGGDAYVTDGRNYVIDCGFSAIADAALTNRALRDVVGVVETGLFVGMTAMALVAGDQGVSRFVPR